MSNGHACCLLGVCCPPGSPAQRRSLKIWLTAKIQGSHFSTVSADEDETGKTVDNWLDELPWGTTAADFDAEGHRIAGPTDAVGGEAV